MSAQQQGGRIRHSKETEAAVCAAIKTRAPVDQIAADCGVSRTYVLVRARRMGLPYPKSPGPDHPWRHPQALQPTP